MSMKKLTGSLFMWLVLRVESPPKQTKWSKEKHKRENIQFPGTALGHRRERAWEDSRCLVLTAAPLIPEHEALGAPSLRYTTLHFMPPLTVLVCYRATHVYERLSSTNTLIEERWDRCGISPQVFSLLLMIWYSVTLFIQNRKYTRFSSSLYRLPMYYHNGILFYFSSCFLSYLLRAPIWRVDIFSDTIHCGSRITRSHS